MTVGGTTYYCNLTNFSYTPISNFWRDQGYIWQYGYTNVTGAGGLQTPLDYADMDKVREAAERSGFAGSLIEIEHDGRYDNNDNYNCTDVRIWAVTFEPDGNTSSRGKRRRTLLVRRWRIYNPRPQHHRDCKYRPPGPLNTSLWRSATRRSCDNETYANAEAPFSPKDSRTRSPTANRA